MTVTYPLALPALPAVAGFAFAPINTVAPLTASPDSVTTVPVKLVAS